MCLVAGIPARTPGPSRSRPHQRVRCRLAGPGTAASRRSCGRSYRTAPPESGCPRRTTPLHDETRCRSSPGSPAMGSGCQMLSQKRDDLPAHLQIRHVTVEVDPIQALHIEHHVPVEHIVDSHRRSHHASLVGQVGPDQRPASRRRRECGRAGSDRFSLSRKPQRSHPTRPPPWRSEAGLTGRLLN